MPAFIYCVCSEDVSYYEIRPNNAHRGTARGTGQRDRGTDEATTTTTTRTEEKEEEEDGAPTTLGQELNE